MRSLSFFLSIIVVSVFIISCRNADHTTEQDPPNVKDKLKNRIDSLDAVIKQTGVLDKSLGINAISAYSDYARNYAGDSLSPEYLFKAAEISSAINMADNAIQLYDNIIANYPQYRKIAYCYFLKAFVYEEKLKDFAKAKACYEEVIQRYPNEKLAQDAAASIQNLGKSDEELIKMFEEKNKTK